MAKRRSSKQQDETFPKGGQQDDKPAGSLWFKVPLKEDGTPDIENLGWRDEKKKNVAELVSNPAFRAALGIGQEKAGSSSSAGSPSEPVVDAQVQLAEPVKPLDLSWVLWVYSVTVCFIFSARLDVPYDVLWPVCKFDEEQKAALLEPLSIVVQRYVPAEWLQFAPEMRLATLLAGITGANFARAKEAAETYRVEHAKNVTPKAKEEREPAKGSRVVSMSNEDKKAEGNV